MRFYFNKILLSARLEQCPVVLFWLCFLMVITLSVTRVAYAASDKYVVNLMSISKAVKESSIKNFAELNTQYNVIVYSKLLGSEKKYVISVGYFSDYQAAKKASISLGKTYKGAYVVKFTGNYTVLKSIKQLPTALSSASSKAETALKPVTRPESVAPPKPVTPSKPVPTLLTKPKKSNSAVSKQNVDKIMRSAKSAIKNGDNRKAIQLFTAVLSMSENKYSEEALELLGVARERNNQYNHAVHNYNKYIAKYPDSEGVSRVMQRLSVLTTATRKVSDQEKRAVKDKSAPWRMTGSLSQSYNNNNAEDIDIYSFLSLTGRKENQSTDLRLQFTGNQISPISDESDSVFQVSEMYADILFKEMHLSTNIGRKRSRSGGLFGRLDGVFLSYAGSGSSRYNFFAGIPVESSKDSLFDTEKNKKLTYGINADVSFLDKSLDVNFYALVQNNDNVLDRQTVGAEVRFFKKSISMFSLLDYDTSYDEVNVFLLSGNWKPAKNYDLFFNADYRQNPLLTTGSALIGQAETDLGTLVSVLGEEAVRQLALDRTATSSLIGIGLLGPWSDSTTIRGDISTTSVSSSEATLSSTGVNAVPATLEAGPDYYYSLQLVTKSFLIKNDTTILQFQYADTSTSKKIIALITTRLPITKNLRTTPRVKWSLTDLELGGERTELRTSILTDYKYNKRLQMSVDVGMDFTLRESLKESERTNYYFTANYHWAF